MGCAEGSTSFPSTRGRQPIAGSAVEAGTGLREGGKGGLSYDTTGVIPIAAKKPDWNRIKAEYIASGTSYRKLAHEYGLTKDAVARHAKAEGWIALRDRTRDAAETKVIQKTADAIATNAAKLERARGLAIDRLIRALEQMPDDGGSHSRETVTDGRKRTTRDHDLLAIVSALEKLAGNQAAETADDPLTALLGRLDDEASV